MGRAGSGKKYSPAVWSEKQGRDRWQLSLLSEAMVS